MRATLNSIYYYAAIVCLVPRKKVRPYLSFLISGLLLYPDPPLLPGFLKNCRWRLDQTKTFGYRTFQTARSFRRGCCLCSWPCTTARKKRTCATRAQPSGGRALPYFSRSFRRGCGERRSRSVPLRERAASLAAGECFVVVVVFMALMRVA